MSFSKPRSFYYLLHPRPVVIVVSRCPNGRVNATPISWITPVSEEPPTIALCIDRENYILQCIEHCGEASINIPSTDSVDTVYGLGTVSGREVDKVKEFGLDLEPCNKVSVPRISKCIGWLETKLVKRVDVGEVALLVMEVLDSYAKSECVTQWGWDVSRCSPLLHGAGRAFYSVGRRYFAGRRA